MANLTRGIQYMWAVNIYIPSFLQHLNMKEDKNSNQALGILFIALWIVFAEGKKIIIPRIFLRSWRWFLHLFLIFLANKMWKGRGRRISLDWGQSFSLARYDTNANIGFEINPNIAKNPTIALIWTFVSNCIMSNIDFDFWPRRWPSTLALANTLVNWPWNLPWRKKSSFSPSKKCLK